MEIQSFEQEFAGRYPERGHLLEKFRAALGTDEVKWEDMTTLNLERIRQYVTENVAPNSAVTYFAVLKSFLTMFADEGVIPCKDPYRVLKAKHVPSQHIALTEEEVLLIDQYESRSKCEMDTKILFMRGCLTGARSSDCKKLSEKNICDGLVRYVSQKTKTEVVQPMHYLLPKYLEMQPEKEHSPSAMCTALRRICKKLGFDEPVTLFVNGRTQTGPKWQFVTLHTARRSFCSNLALRGVPIETIAKLAGHTQSQITSRTYVVINTKTPGDAAMAFFGEE